MLLLKQEYAIKSEAEFKMYSLENKKPNDDGSSVWGGASLEASCKQANANVHFHVNNE